MTTKKITYRSITPNLFSIVICIDPIENYKNKPFKLTQIERDTNDLFNKKIDDIYLEKTNKHIIKLNWTLMPKIFFKQEEYFFIRCFHVQLDYKNYNFPSLLSPKLIIKYQLCIKI